jgi:hypothetical protein
LIRFVRALPSAPSIVTHEDQGIFRRLVSLIATEQIRELMHWMVDTGPAIILSFLFFLTPGMPWSHRDDGGDPALFCFGCFEEPQARFNLCSC